MCFHGDNLIYCLATKNALLKIYLSNCIASIVCYISTVLRVLTRAKNDVLT